MSARLVAAFRGHAQCRRESGAVQWCLRGIDREGGMPLEVLISGAPDLQLPAQLASAELYELAAGGATPYELRSAGRAIPVVARAVQVHRDVAAAFDAVLPRFGVAWSVRLGWLVLLNVLRVPGAARLLGRLRAGGAS
jgi:hypothetical protein